MGNQKLLRTTSFVVRTVPGAVLSFRLKGEGGNPILMLNVFAQKIKLYLTSDSVHGDKTNEPGCLKQHPEGLFRMYPTIQILTGDAIFAQRPLLEALREYHRDYLFQIKDNQGKVLEQLTLLFDDAKKNAGRTTK